ncbi:MAG: efflux RND transporter periplasmic adaptor subunit [Candidatus Aminicenantes bacterium]|nr:efflux RND transporter periplasmic adaptor subunit [Candidatus Aminicenantes bacterium]
MRNRTILLLTLILALAWACGKSGSGDPAANGSPQTKAQPGSPSGKGAPGAKGPGGQPQLEALPVNIETVSRRSLSSYLVLNGIVEPERKVEVYSRLSAYVNQIIKEEGAYVRENDILAVLDDTEIRISYEQSKIALEQAKLTLDEAEKNLVRSQELFKKDLIAEQEFQTVEAAHKQRDLDHQNRQENFKDLELQLNWTKIKSPAEGYITERLIEAGGRVSGNQQVYTIEDFKPLLVRVFVPTSDAIMLKTGLPADVSTEILKGEAFKGAVTLINPRVDVQTGTIKVTVEVYDDTLRLKPGMFVEVRIATGEKENVLVIPRKAILYKQGKTFVFVLQNNLAGQREVTLGLTEEDQAEVTSGLAEGDVIISVGVENIKDGQPATVLK